jgi:glycosyltransferase involved in cell wall biosynthesis
VPLPFQPSLTVVVPAFNERENLPRVLGELHEWGRAHARDFEILVIDDGSSDGTYDVIQKHTEIRVIRHERNQGLTAALRTGFYGAAREFVTWVPADGQIPAAEMGKILAAWDGHDLVMSNYTHRPDGWRRAMMSRGLRVLLFLATGLRDRMDSTYLFRRALLDELELVARTSAGSIGFEIGAKARAAGKRITTTEIECKARLSGASKVANARNIAAYLGELWRIRQSMRRRRG